MYLWCIVRNETTDNLWVFEDEPNPTKVVRGRSTSKQMAASFFGKLGPFHHEHRRTVNLKWFTTICLPKVFGEIWKTNKSRRIIVHHDNARSHTSAQTSVLLTGQTSNWWVICPDLPTNDLFISAHSEQNAWLVKDFRCFSSMFWSCLYRSGKTALISGLSANKVLFNSSSTFQIVARFLVAPSVWKFYRLIVYLSVMLCFFHDIWM